ncbi:MAG: prolyl oligopeptidase family serine peptidase, partial [Terrimicrobiaceae bacterium]|nr:prolyl oligopeptidase family serine peptidase [Terrimicrobiaceae bacterium]
FSAGGHLAGICAMRWADWTARAGLDLAQPAGAALIYPVVSFQADFAQCGARLRLAGEDPGLRKLLSVENAVSAASPPVFLVHSDDDPTVPVAHSELLLAACQKHGVSAELHRYPAGGHGYGIARGAGSHGEWPARFEAWLDRLLDRPGGSSGG